MIKTLGFVKPQVSGGAAMELREFVRIEGFVPSRETRPIPLNREQRAVCSQQHASERRRHV